MTQSFPTKALGLSLIGAGVVNLAAIAAAASGSTAAAANLGSIGYALFIPATFAVVAVLYRVAPRPALAAGFLTAFGIPAAVLWAALPLMATGAEAQLALPLYVGGLALPLAGIVLAVGLWRSALAPLWVSAALGVANVLFVVSWFVPGAPVALASAALLAAAFGWLGAQFWGGAFSAESGRLAVSA